MDCFDMQMLLTLFFFLIACPAVYTDRRTRTPRLLNVSSLDLTYTRKIINKLGFLPVRHNQTYMDKIRKSLPQPITTRINRQNTFHPTAAPYHDRDVMVVGEHMEHGCLETMTSACFVVRVGENVQQLKRATLWVDLKLNEHFVGRTITINEVRIFGNSVQVRERIGNPIVLSRRTGGSTESISADMTGMVRRWSRYAGIVNKNVFSRTIAVICTDCPFLVESPVKEDRVILELTLYPRRRRSKRGSGRQFMNLCGSIPIFCCLQRYTLNFARVGWESWVVYPASFSPNYCMGSCEGGNVLPQTQHASMLAAAVRNMNNLSDRQRNSMLPCCAPTAMGSFTLMYLDPKGKVRLNQMNNLVAYDCGCM